MVYLKLDPEEYGLLKKSLTLNIQNYYDLAIDAFAVNDIESARNYIATKLEFEKLHALLDSYILDASMVETDHCDHCGTPLLSIKTSNDLAE